MRGPRTLCSIRVYNPGSGGGSSTVQTDGVTIQGDGSTGNKIALKQVETNAGLTGAGTLASLLGITPLTFYSIGAFGGGVFQGTTANTLVLQGVIIPFPVTFANLTFWLQADDSTHNSDIGIYTAAGALLANLGAQHLTGVGSFQTIATLQGSQTIQAGKYLVGWTSVASTLALYTDLQTNAPFTWFSSTSYGTSSGGAMPATITAPTQAIGRGGVMPWIGLS